ncbi:hypothetical protein CGK27_22875, partial [Vibrio parahaemolyticus]
MGKKKANKVSSLRSYELTDAERIAIIRRELAAMQLRELQENTCSQQQTGNLFDYQTSTRFREYVRNA